MNLNTDSLVKYFTPIKSFFNRYGAYVYLTIMVAIISFLLIRITTLINAEPIEEQSTSIKSITIDSSTAQKILELKDQNVTVNPENNNSRTNPF